MAKKNTAADKGPPPRKPAAAAPQPSDPLARARIAEAAGNNRGARSLARQIAATGPDSERPEAAEILHHTAPDPRALVTTLAVLAIILFALWVAILRAH